MKSFEVGKTYVTRFASDADSRLEVQVLKRTPKRITISTRAFGVKTVGTWEYDGVECARPLGKYSMAPIISADREKEENPNQ